MADEAMKRTVKFVETVTELRAEKHGPPPPKKTFQPASRSITQKPAETDDKFSGLVNEAAKIEKPGTLSGLKRPVSSTKKSKVEISREGHPQSPAKSIPPKANPPMAAAAGAGAGAVAGASTECQLHIALCKADDVVPFSKYRLMEILTSSGTKTDVLRGMCIDELKLKSAKSESVLLQAKHIPMQTDEKISVDLSDRSVDFFVENEASTVAIHGGMASSPRVWVDQADSDAIGKKFAGLLTSTERHESKDRKFVVRELPPTSKIFLGGVVPTSFHHENALPASTQHAFRYVRVCALKVAIRFSGERTFDGILCGFTFAEHSLSDAAKNPKWHVMAKTKTSSKTMYQAIMKRIELEKAYVASHIPPPELPAPPPASAVAGTKRKPDDKEEDGPAAKKSKTGAADEVMEQLRHEVDKLKRDNEQLIRERDKERLDFQRRVKIDADGKMAASAEAESIDRAVYRVMEHLQKPQSSDEVLNTSSFNIPDSTRRNLEAIITAVAANDRSKWVKALKSVRDSLGDALKTHGDAAPSPHPKVHIAGDAEAASVFRDIQKFIGEIQGRFMRDAQDHIDRHAHGAFSDLMTKTEFAKHFEDLYARFSSLMSSKSSPYTRKITS